MALHAAFALALAAVFTARHALLFLLAWEGMTLLSAALVASDTRSARARSACFVYLAISHVGAALLSGAMVKAGLYGLLRFAWQMPGLPIAGWGMTLVALGTITALIGALYA